MNMAIDIPVIMYHTVGVNEPAWRWHFLTTPWQMFESQLSFLKSKGFQSITLTELYAFRTGQGGLPPKPVLFTFDDGYLDNWVYAAPLLKKYGFSGTIFVNPEFVDPSVVPRPSLKEVWAGTCALQDLPKLGFLSWAEMRELQSSGVMDIQSHAMTHTWYPVNSDIIDFRHPGDEYVWMDWNSAPDRKWAYLTPQEVMPVRFGEPVYENKKSLAGPRYFPDAGLSDYLIAYTAEQGDGFFSRAGWRETLNEVVKTYQIEHQSQERYETSEEYNARLEWELGESQRLIAEKLSKKVEFLCWPGGGYAAEAVQIARRLYKASTLASRDPAVPGFDEEGHLRIKRIGVPCIEKGEQYLYPDGRYLYHTIREFQGSRLHRKIRQCLKLKVSFSSLEK